MSLIPGEKNQIIVKPFVYGSIAIGLGKKTKGDITHKWCVYVRGVNNENISNFIKSVQFTLHNTFPNNVRVIDKWPFELYEMGWGEFEIKIKIELIDETAKPIELVHPLKFYNQQHQSSNKKPVVNENYDEIIFVNPKPEILEQLLKYENNNNNSNIIFQEPIINKKSLEDEKDSNKDNINNMGSSMEIEEEDKSLATNSQLNQNLNLNNNNSIISNNDKIPMIPNISQYFNKFDDSAIIKELNEENEFVIQEIEKLKQELKKKKMR